MFDRIRDCKRSRSIAEWTIETLGVGAKDAGKGTSFPQSFVRNHIAPFDLHIESARTRPGTGQNGANKHLTSLIAEITERWTGSLGL